MSTSIERLYVNIDDQEIVVSYTEVPEVEEGKEGRYIATITDVALEGLLHQVGFRKV